MNGSGRTPRMTLTRREREIVAPVVDGYSNREIAERFGLSDQTIKNYLSVIFAKVGANDRVQLAIYAVRHDFARLHDDPSHASSDLVLSG